MRDILGVVGQIIFLLAGIPLWVFEIIWFERWWGIVGVLVGIFIPPLAIAFPFIHLAKEGQGSPLFLGMFVLVVVGFVLAGVGRQESETTYS